MNGILNSINILGFSLTASTINSGAAPAKPNVVFIITDDQSWDTLAFMGGQVYTPRLDQMRNDGIYLSDFNVTSTVCSPSRYAFLTGRYAGNCTGALFMNENPEGTESRVENICELEPERWNLGKILQKNGYKTGFIGKSHVVNPDWLHGRKGWESFGFQSYPQDADPRDPEVNAKMQHNHRQWCEAIRGAGFDYANGIYGGNLRELFSEELNVHNLDWTVSKAFNFLEQYKNEPFFLYVATTLHHGPAPWNNKFSLKADPRMTGEGFVEDGFSVLPSRSNVLERAKAAGFAEDKAFALWMDDGVGAILDKIESLGLSENTLIFYVPDHGIYRHGKATLHDYGMRVPMLIQWKGKIYPGSTYDEIVANIDFAPTILDVCGIPVSDEFEMDGKSFKAALLGSKEPIRDYLFSELGYSRAVRSKEWKYIAIRYPEDVVKKILRGGTFNNFEDNPPLPRPYLVNNSHLGYHAAKENPHYFETDQLYNLIADREENTNVFAAEPDVVRVMKAELTAQLAQFKNRPFGEFTTPAGGVLPENTNNSPPEIQKPVEPPDVPAKTAIMEPSLKNKDSILVQCDISGVQAWKSTRREGNLATYFYYSTSDASFRNGKMPRVEVVITYLDSGNTKVTMQYDSSDESLPHAAGAGVWKRTDSFNVKKTGEWKTQVFQLTDAFFARRCNGMDLRIAFANPDTDPVIATVLLRSF